MSRKWNITEAKHEEIAAVAINRELAKEKCGRVARYPHCWIGSSDIEIVLMHIPTETIMHHDFIEGVLEEDPDSYFREKIREARERNYTVRNLTEAIHELADMIDVPEEELLCGDLPSIQETEDGAPTYAVRQENDWDWQFGAIGPFINRELRRRIRVQVGGDYFLLPTSVHETMAVRDVKGNWQAHFLYRFVMENNGNRDIIKPQDVLSDTIFHVGDDLDLYELKVCRIDKSVTG